MGQHVLLTGGAGFIGSHVAARLVGRGDRAEAMQVKIDELIRATEGAHNALLDLEDLDEETLDRVRAAYAKIAGQARQNRKTGALDTDRPDVDDDNGG